MHAKATRASLESNKAHLELCARYKGVLDPYSPAAQKHLIGFTDSDQVGGSTDKKYT